MGMELRTTEEQVNRLRKIIESHIRCQPNDEKQLFAGVTRILLQVSDEHFGVSFQPFLVLVFLSSLLHELFCPFEDQLTTLSFLQLEGSDCEKRDSRHRLTARCLILARTSFARDTCRCFRFLRMTSGTSLILMDSLRKGESEGETRDRTGLTAWRTRARERLGPGGWGEMAILDAGCCPSLLSCRAIHVFLCLLTCSGEYYCSAHSSGSLIIFGLIPCTSESVPRAVSERQMKSDSLCCDHCYLFICALRAEMSIQTILIPSS